MEIVAHWGFGGAFPENTLFAFEQAAATADWIELDVRRCKSGELVVFHDETLDRVTGGSGRVINTSWSELQDLEVLDSGEGIPRFGEALAAIPPDTGVEVELKEFGTVSDVLETLTEVENQSAVISFSPLALHAATTHEPATSVGHILYEGLYEDAPTLGLDMAAHLGCETVHLYYSMGSTAAVVDAAHDRNVAVQAATPETGPTDEVLETCRSVGVDRLSADRPIET